MAQAKKKLVAMKSRKSGKKKSIQIKKNNEILSKLKSEFK